MRTLEFPKEDWRSSSGDMIQVCAVHEIEALVKPEEEAPAVAAITTLGGFALCREHFDYFVVNLQSGVSTSTLLMKFLGVEIR